MSTAHLSMITGHPVIQRPSANFQALCNELSLFETNVSPWINPLEWAHLNTQHLLDIADKLLGMQSGAAAFGDLLVYPRVTVYVFACVTRYFFTARPAAVHDLLIDLNQTIESWKTQGDIQCLVKHSTIKDYLKTMIDSCVQLGVLTLSEELLDRLFKLDTIAINASLLSVLQGREGRDGLLALRGHEAQLLLDTLQTCLELPIEPSFRRLATSVLVKLSRASGLYPECLVLKDVRLVGGIPVAGGSHGDIWKGVYRGNEVAVKVLKTNSMSLRKTLKAFTCEVVAWRQLCHPNILPFYGVSLDEDLSLISPWMKNDNITQFVKRHPNTDRTLLTLDIAMGLEYLHNMTPNIIHGDLKATNILITSSRRACIADFGLSAVPRSTGSIVGRWRWLAPELLDPDGDHHERLSLASDIYAFGCVSYEVFSGNVPFHEVSHDFRAMQAVLQGKRPSRPSHDLCRTRGLTDEIWNTIQSCWAHQPIGRPSAGHILEELRALTDQPADQLPADGFTVATKSTSSNVPIIHSAKLPTLDVSLDHALTNFGTDICPWKCPTEWLHSNADHLDSIVRSVATLTTSEYPELSARAMIYPRLIVYVFAHLALCTSHKDLLDEFKKILRQWQTWDRITVLQNHDIIKGFLYDLFRRGLQSCPTLHSERVFRELLTCDVIGLCAHLAITVTDDYMLKTLLARRDEGAQSLLNLLQARLELSVHPKYRACHIDALEKLSRAAGLHPECLRIEMEKYPVARGSYGDVHKGTLRGKVLAIKVLRIYRDSDLVHLLKRVLSEAVLWRKLSHPNILPFYGIYHLAEEIPKIGLTSPWMEKGNLVEFIKNNPETDYVRLALDIACGMEYLHSHNISHRDLKGVNVLVTSSERACLADFGFALANDPETNYLSRDSKAGTCTGTIRWQAPELLSGDAGETEGDQHDSQASDIYAYACVCYEIFSGQIPFYEIQNEFRVMRDVVEGRRPSRPSHDLCEMRGLTDEIWRLIQACWDQDPKKRPTASEVVQRLRALPNRPVDQRSADNFDTPFPSQEIYTQAGHPFSAIADIVQWQSKQL